MRYEGTIDVLAMQGRQSGSPKVLFLPYTSSIEGGACGGPSFDKPYDLAAFLADLEIRAQVVTEAMGEVSAGHTVSIPNVLLDDEDIQLAGLDSAVTLKRRIR